MPMPILATKLYIPPPNANLVSRSRLLEALNQGLTRKLTVISAPAGFGKTTLLSDWLYTKDEGGKMKGEERNLHPARVAWLSLDESDNDLAEFLIYLIAALQQIDPDIGQDILTTLRTSAAPRRAACSWCATGGSGDSSPPWCAGSRGRSSR